MACPAADRGRHRGRVGAVHDGVVGVDAARVSNDFAQFGTFGIALSFVTWLTGLCFLLVGAAVLGPALADGADVVGRWLRSGEATALQPWADPALPGPVRPVRLSDAFGRGSGGSGVPDATGAAGPHSARLGRGTRSVPDDSVDG